MSRIRRCGLGQVALPCLPAGQHGAEAQVGRPELGLGLLVEPAGRGGVAAEVRDQGGVQRRDAAEPALFQVRLQGRQRRLRAAAAGLRPGDQQRAEHLGQRARRQAGEPRFGVVPAPRLRVGVRQHQLRHRVVRQLGRELRRIRPAGHHRGDERLGEHLAHAAVLGRGLQLVGRHVEVRALHRGPAGEVGAERPAGLEAGAARRVVETEIARRARREGGQDQQGGSAEAHVTSRSGSWVRRRLRGPASRCSAAGP